MEYIHYYHSPLGRMTMGSDGEALLGVWFDGQKYFGSTLSNGANIEETKNVFCDKKLFVFQETEKWLDLYFGGKAPNFTPRLNIKNTDFRKAIWEILLTIPYGKTMTYGEIAKKLAEQKGMKSMSAQAVGGAVGHNPFSLIIPCHRVVGAGGSMVGYAGGIDKKMRLLAMEKKGFKERGGSNYVY